MQRVVRLDLAYDGTDFQGFSVQPERRTVQGVLEHAWHQITGETVRITAAGRTDTGVHAEGQVGSVRTASTLPAPALMRALNALLPSDVAVLAVRDESATFDARRSAVRRSYRYTIWNARTRNVRWRMFSWHVTDPLDMERMQSAARMLLGSHDFRVFSARLKASGEASPARRVSRAEWVACDDGFLHFQIDANGFLRRMVRGIVGTLVAIGRGRLEPAAMNMFLNGTGAGERPDFAPPHGLTLMRVDY